MTMLLRWRIPAPPFTLRWRGPEGVLDAITAQPLAPLAAFAVPAGSGPPGDEGDAGPSAYEVAVANGFVGNQAAWLASLVGEPGTSLPPLGLWDYWTESWFGNANAAAPDHWLGAAISAGTNNTALPAASMQGFNRHGVFLRSGTTANGGFRYLTSSTGGQYFGVKSHKFRCAFLWRTAFTGRTVRLGYLDTTTNADSTDGAYFEIIDALCSAKTASNNARTANPVTLTLALDVAYTFDIEVNAAGTEARFRVYAGQSETPVMDVTNTANIPTSSARVFGSGIIATEASITASDIGILYWMGEGTVEAFQRARG